MTSKQGSRRSGINPIYRGCLPGELQLDLGVWQRPQVLQAARPALLHQRIQDRAYARRLDVRQAADPDCSLHCPCDLFHFEEMC